jgi:hypothetical protein
MTSVLMNAAIEYARRGWKVFPVKQNAKVPHARLSKNGYKCATNDLSIIKDWWTAWPMPLRIYCVFHGLSFPWKATIR